MINVRDCFSTRFEAASSDYSGSSTTMSGPPNGARNRSSNPFPYSDSLIRNSKGPGDPKQVGAVNVHQQPKPKPPPRNTTDVPPNLALGEKICEGAYPGVLWVAGTLTFEKHTRLLAVRRISVKSCGNDVFMRFQEENGILKVIKHKNILPCVSWWSMTDKRGKKVYMSYPRCQIADMESYVAQQESGLEEEKVKNIMGQISQALQ